MKSNFSEFDYKKLYNIFNGPLFNVRINKGGNISLSVKNLNLLHLDPEVGKYWTRRDYTFYKTKDGFLIRSLSYGYGMPSIFPLNMKVPTRTAERTWYNNKFHYHYGVKWSAFETLDDAIVYFIEYLNKYHNIINF